MEKPIKMDDLGIPLFSETSIYMYIYIYICSPVFLCGGDSTIRQSLVVVFLLSAGILVLALPALRTLSRQGSRFFNDQMKVRLAFLDSREYPFIWLDDLGLAYLW